jgi:hypothetical protein
MEEESVKSVRQILAAMASAWRACRCRTAEVRSWMSNAPHRRVMSMGELDKYRAARHGLLNAVLNENGAPAVVRAESW